LVKFSLAGGFDIRNPDTDVGFQRRAGPPTPWRRG